ncbi:uncharacterized protein EDB91DRAFT_1251440 [Suillus paluster]|uniref:uncharacterized protein n=1 Tax=Suillus paluster TaxID=48578 RepID=UPI001B86B0ED|nr:uncharacterized protein EDB91DRAFT_1251440 [Suillus paluster]KAG1733200.1 hypothetical protein EDB91DRAFT_1251440 [Suillus paluster]
MEDANYSSLYDRHPEKFVIAIANRLTLKNIKHSGQDLTRLAVELTPLILMKLPICAMKDVLKQFPFYDDLDKLWHDNPSYAPKAFSSDPKANHSDHLQSIMHTKSTPTSTFVGSSCLPADNEDLYADTNTQLPQPPSFNVNDDESNYDMVNDNNIYPDDSEMHTGNSKMDVGDGEMDVGDGEMDVGDGVEGDYEMGAFETETAGRNHTDKHPHPFSPSPPPQPHISQLTTPLYDMQALFTTHADRALNRTPLPKSHHPPFIASSISGSVQMCTPTLNMSFSTKAKSIKYVCDKVQLLAQGVVAEYDSAKSSEKMIKLQIHQKECDQMFALGEQLMQQLNSSLDCQHTLESKNADICLKQAKAQTHTLEMELIRRKLQLGEQQLKLQQHSSD